MLLHLGRATAKGGLCSWPIDGKAVTKIAIIKSFSLQAKLQLLQFKLLDDGGPELGVDGGWTVVDLELVKPINDALLKPTSVTYESKDHC